MQIKNSDGNINSTCYWSGIYPEFPINKLDICAQFADKLLCYDTCIITYEDYLFLVGVLGFKTVHTLYYEGAIEIYNNKGVKASITNVAENDPFILNFSFNNTMDPEKVIAEYQRIYNTEFNSEFNSQMIKILGDAKQVDFGDAFIRTLNEETTSDLNNPKITQKLGLLNGGKITDKDHDFNQFLYNRIAYLNLYMSLGNALSLNNIMLPAVIQDLLDVKLGAYSIYNNHEQYTAFTSITEYAGIEDTSKLISNGILNFSDIIKIRNNKHSAEFRSWLEKICRSGFSSSSEVNDYVQLYNTAVKEGVKLKDTKESIILKSLKFAVPTAIGCIPTPITAGASLLMNTSLFIKDIVKKNFKPNIFIDDFLKEEISNKMNESKLRTENANFIKLYGKISPNEKCPCGSNKKYKKCHGIFR